MLIEATAVIGLPVVEAHGLFLGKVDQLAFDPKNVSLSAVRVRLSGVARQSRRLNWQDVLSLSRKSITVDSAAVLSKATDYLEELRHRGGVVIGVRAVTESGKKLGQVSDVLIEHQTGSIVRFYLRQFLSERIIPQQYLVNLAPQAVVFKDIVSTPILNQAAEVAT